MSPPEVVPIKVTGGPKLTKFSDIEERQLEWLWPGRIPMGKLTVIAGDPGFGKSLLTVAMAATVTNEVKWPDCGEYAPFGSVILLSSEDDNADTVKPRLISAGADQSKVFSLSSMIENPDGTRRGFSFDKDTDKLTHVVKSVPDCRLVVIDPISAFMGNADSHNVAEVRGVLHELSELAQQQRFAVVYVTHLNKGKGTPMSRVSGSGAYVAAARSAMLVGRDPVDSDRRILTMLKANLSKETSSAAYRIAENENGHPVIQWELGTNDLKPEDLLGSDSSDSHSALSEAMSWLNSELSGGPVNTKKLQILADDAGHAWRTVQRAQAKLNVVAKKTGVGGAWQWWCPDELDEGRQSKPRINGGDVGGVGDLNHEVSQERQDSHEIHGY